MIVTDNLFGDILTDLAGAVAGGVGLRRHRQPQPRPDGAVDVRARARLGPRQRRHRPGQRQLADPLRPRCCSSSWARPTPAPASARPSTDVLAAEPHADHHRRPRRRKGLRTMPLAEGRKHLDGRRARRLGRRQGPRAHPHAALRLRRVRGHPGLRDDARARPSSGSRDHIERLFNSAKIFMHRHPVRASTSSSRPPRRRCGRTASTPATSGRSSTWATARWASTRCRARSNVSIAVLAVGRLPRRRGHQERRPHEDLLVAAPRPERHAAGGQGHRHVHQLVDGQGRGHQGRLRRGRPAVAPGLRVASAPARTSSSSRTAGSSRRPSSAGALEGITQDSVHDDRPRPRHRGTSTATSSAPTSTPPTRRSCPAPPPRSCRSARSTTARSATPGPITRQIQETFFAAVRGEIDRYKDWNEHVR